MNSRMVLAGNEAATNRHVTALLTTTMGVKSLSDIVWPFMRCGLTRSETMARIKHIAFYAEDPQRMADFYVEVFGMKITRKGKDDAGNPVSVWVTDGYMDVALIKARGKMKPGINHFGWTLEAAEKE